MKIGLQVTHVCGHAGYHVVEDPGKGPKARKFFDSVAARPCDDCIDNDEEEDACARSSNAKL